MKVFYFKKGIDPTHYGFKRNKDISGNSRSWSLGKSWSRITIRDEDNRITFNIPRNEDIYVLMQMYADGNIEIEEHPRYKENNLEKRIAKLERKIKELENEKN